jgi:CubicO group peptidase (beta-lactamase class C family)
MTCLFTITSLLVIPVGSLDTSLYSTSSQVSEERSYWPTDGWRNSTPEEQGMDSNTLSLMLETAIDEEYPYLSILIVRNGYIVFENYSSPYLDADYQQHVHSVTKSFISCLIGIAIDQGIINGVNDTVLEYFPEREIDNRDELKEYMTIEHLLTMTPGFAWDEQTYPYGDPRNDYTHVYFDQDSLQYILDRPMTAVPGAEWVYNSGASHLLSGILSSATGQHARDFADENLFTALGIESFQWESAFDRITYGGSGLHLTPRDMAKFGFLYLNNGTWDGQQVVSEDWVLNSTSIHYDETYYPMDGFGYHWWRLHDYNVIIAKGRYGQLICILPDYDMVVVFTAKTTEDNPHRYFNLLIDYIIPSAEPDLVAYDPLTLTIYVSLGAACVVGTVIRFVKRRD